MIAIAFSLGVLAGFLLAAWLIVYMRRPLVIERCAPDLPPEWRPRDAS